MASGVAYGSGRTDHRIKYVYWVGGKSYVSRTISFRMTGSGEFKSPSEVVAKYPLKSKCTVYYDPRNPLVSVLEAGTSESNARELKVGPFMIAGGIVLWLYIRRRLREMAIKELAVVKRQYERLLRERGYETS
jgi:hypothetical protein